MIPVLFSDLDAVKCEIDDRLSQRLNELITKASVPSLMKAGKEGYIHGWVCVNPPCGKKHDLVSHADHGIGMIDDVDADGNLHAVFTNGTAGILGSSGDSKEVEARLKEKAAEDAERRKQSAPKRFQVKKNKPLTQAERMSIDGYTSEAGNRVYNDSLRAGQKPMAHHDDLDSAISKHTADEDGVVYRGMALPEHLDLSPGTEFTDHGYMSTSEDRKIAEDFAHMRATGKTPAGLLDADGAKVFGGKPVVMRIRVKKGDHAMRGDNSVKEIILPRGQRYRVTSADPDGVVDLERLA